MTGEYSNFWTEHVPRESTAVQLAELLDGIAGSLEDCKDFMLGEVGTNTRMARLPVDALEQVLRDTRGRIAADQLYNWLGMFSDNGLRVLDRDIVSLRFRLEWDAEALKALIAHAVRDLSRQRRRLLGFGRSPPVRGAPLPLRPLVHREGARGRGTRSRIVLSARTIRLCHGQAAGEWFDR